MSALGSSVTGVPLLGVPTEAPGCGTSTGFPKREDCVGKWETNLDSPVSGGRPNRPPEAGVEVVFRDDIEPDRGLVVAGAVPQLKELPPNKPVNGELSPKSPPETPVEVEGGSVTAPNEKAVDVGVVVGWVVVPKTVDIGVDPWHPKRPPVECPPPPRPLPDKDLFGVWSEDSGLGDWELGANEAEGVFPTWEDLVDDEVMFVVPDLENQPLARLKGGEGADDLLV